MLNKYNTSTLKVTEIPVHTLSHIFYNELIIPYKGILVRRNIGEFVNGCKLAEAKILNWILKVKFASLFLQIHFYSEVTKLCTNVFGPGTLQ